MSEDDRVVQSVGESSIDPPGFVHHSAAISDTGHRRDNQDSFLVEDELGLYMVADGVGGHQAGDVASATATRVIRDMVADWRRQKERTREHTGALVHRAIETACATIHRMASEDRELAGMSTTVTMVLIDGGTAVMGHVGDSRLYLLREGTLEQISTDHTLAAELYRGGVIAREHVDRHPHSHVLTRNCGTQPSVMVETLLLEIHPGDMLLLCTDGLNPALRPPEHVVDLLDSATDLAGALGQLAERAKASGSRDNITAVAWRRDGGDPSLTRRTVDALRSVPLFAHLSMADLSHVASVMHPRSYDAGHVVLHRGDRNAALYVVLDGRLRWELPSGHFAYIDRGRGIGTTTLVAARRSPAELRAETPAHVLVLSCEAFRDLARLRSRLGIDLLTSLADELSDWIDPETDRGVARPPHGLLVEF
ncbi:MAG: protein phosphatase 2C domain-containing protein [Myxococcales bacterium]|nr:protein phosphatase 2C domain-containing protein [Myxococcales bacterium]MCB9715630.1 protein phosphatase 2C domain-containing protein [Myxococcales bacterium]